MPAPSAHPLAKIDISLFKDDVDFLKPYLRDRNSTITDVTRDLLHRYANEKRRQLGLALTLPHPPGSLP